MIKIASASSSGIIDQLKVMRLQEDSPTYKCRQYIEDIDDVMNCDQSVDSCISECECATGQQHTLSHPIDAECRLKMVQWCYQIVTFANFHRETVSIAMSFLDRFLSSNHPNARKAIANRKEYQLSCITTLYLAIKMYEREEVDPKNFAALARGTHSKDEIIRMEATILSALDWRMSGPTSFTFLHYLLEISSIKLKSDTFLWSKITNLASYQIQLAVGDNFFVPYQPSLLAVASIMNALEPMQKDIPASDRMIFLRRITDVIGIHPLSSALWEVKNRLWAIIERGRLLESLDLKVEKPTPKEHFQLLNTLRYTSPVCVSRSIQTKRKNQFE